MAAETRITRSAGGVVINHKGEVLICSQHGTSWSLPKGHIDPGEDALTAAKREILEESGLTQLELVRELGSYTRYRIGQSGGEDRTEQKMITLFLFRTPEIDLKPIDPENPEARWVTKEQIVKMLTHEKDKEFFTKIAAEI